MYIMQEKDEFFGKNQCGKGSRFVFLLLSFFFTNV